MSVFLESPLAVGALGLLLVTLAAIPYVQTRSRGAFGLLLVALLLTAGGIAFERYWLTPREQVRQSLGLLFEGIRSNDLPAVLRRIDSSATEVQSDAQTLMPMFNVEAASVGGEVAVELPDSLTDGAIAVAKLKPLIRVQHKQSGAVVPVFEKLEVDFVRRGDEWLVKAYRPAENKKWREEASRLGR
jgi:hypothetical protein